MSLEEKVWQCEETGKVCFTEQQMELHRRRIPEAKTFIEKTVADLQKAHNDRLAAEEAGELETEEEMLLRAAGKKPPLSKGAAGKPAGPPVVTKVVIVSNLTAFRARLAFTRAHAVIFCWCAGVSEPAHRDGFQRSSCS